MIIEEIILENYLCYYDIKPFPFGDGLNIILGENGEGKTKFFEAVDWLFKDENSNLDTLVSSKKLGEVGIDDSFRVRVSIRIKQNNDLKIVSKQFLVTKKDNNKCETTSPTLEGIEENSSGERIKVDGKKLREQIFPTNIRRYSMFKGESSLDIFNQTDTLIELIKAFSDANRFEKYAEKGKFLMVESEKAVDIAAKNNLKDKKKFNLLESEIQELEREKHSTKILLNSSTDQIRKLKINIEEAENFVSNAEELENVNKRIQGYRDKIETAKGRIKEDFTTALFDEKWILLHFEDLLNSFTEKISSYSTKRRDLQRQFDTEIGIKIGEKRAQAKLLNDAIPLPNTVPSKAIMEEMLAAELCKVCNRPAKVGSEAYEFMLSRLEDYIKSQIPIITEPEKEEKLFLNDYSTKLENLSSAQQDNLRQIRKISAIIKDVFEFNEKQRGLIEKYSLELEKELEERNRIIGNSTIGESKLQDVLKNYNGWQKDLLEYQHEEKDLANKLRDINIDLKVKKSDKDNIGIQNANTFLIKTRAILRDIFTIFNETKKAKFDEFVNLLQKKSNEYFSKINFGAFTGEIVFFPKFGDGPPSVSIELMEDGKILYRPNQSLETSKHISILFAISELASERVDERFPMIFDAPTSSFGETKTGAFLNIISETGNQVILLLKDFIVQDKGTQNLTLKPEFGNVKRDRALWVRLERPFNPLVLNTINTEIITL